MWGRPEAQMLRPRCSLSSLSSLSCLCQMHTLGAQVKQKFNRSNDSSALDPVNLQPVYSNFSGLHDVHEPYDVNC